MINPKVSVIIPVYNAEKYLRECLDSVVNQTLKDIEIICVDDGSTDNSLSILEEYAAKDKRVQIIQQQNQYAGVARNNGLKVARGEYVYFMDSDDFIDLETLAKTCARGDVTNAEIVVFDFLRFDNDSGEEKLFTGLNRNSIKRFGDCFNWRDVPHNICSIINPTPWNKLIRRSFILSNGLEYMPLSTTNDITFTANCVMTADKITYLSETFYHYRIGNGETITLKKRNNLDNIIYAVLSVEEYAKKLPYYEEIKDSIRKFVLDNLFVGVDRYAGDPDSVKCADYISKLESIFCCHPLFVGESKVASAKDTTNERYRQYKNNGLKRHDFRYGRKIIVSFTTYPKRVGTLHHMLASLKSQTLQPDKIVLYLSEAQFPNHENDLPVYLLEYRECGLEIRWTHEDLRSHKKYYYSMQEFPEAVIVIVDDDLIFKPDLLEKLYVAYLRYPNAIIAARVHVMTYNGDVLEPYVEWLKENSEFVMTPSMALFSTSGSGTLYPPRCMHGELFDKDGFMENCFYADDIWLKLMQVAANMPTVLIDEKHIALHYIPGTQEETLYQINRIENDKQLSASLAYLESKEILTRKMFDERVQKETQRLSRMHERNTAAHLKQCVQLLEQEKKQVEQAKKNVETERNALKKHLQDVESGWSFRIGRIITWLPRKLLGKKW